MSALFKIKLKSNTNDCIITYYTVNTGKLCPTGWHVPTDSDWTILINFLGGNSVAGGKLKYSYATGIIDLYNLTNFEATPSGIRSLKYDLFDRIWIVNTDSQYGTFGGWWTSTIDPNGVDTIIGYHYGTSYGYSIYNDSGSINRGSFPYKTGLSVRCIKN